MITRQQKEQLLKMRMLSYLQDPARREFGAHGTDVTYHAKEHRDLRGIQADEVLKGLLNDGLVERRTDPKNRNAKPYFIADAGDRYYEAQAQSAIFPEFALKDNWTDQKTRTHMGTALSDHLRTLPEFANASDDRIREAGLSLTKVVEDTVSRML